MDYSNALGIEYRAVKDAEHQGQPVRIVSGSRTYSAEIEELWDAVTNSERIPRWFAPITGELKLGGRYQLEGNAGGDITRCDPPRALDVTWECGNVSWVTVRLESVTGGTRLTLEHLMGKDEAGTLAALKSYRKDLINPKAAQYHGRTVKLMGDGALMEFASAVDALTFAMEIQIAMRAGRQRGCARRPTNCLSHRNQHRRHHGRRRGHLRRWCKRCSADRGSR